MKAQTVLGFDFGTQKIGLAIGQTATCTATPLCILKAKEGIPNWQALGKIILQWQPDLLLVGLPLNMDGSESEISSLARKFARRLNGRFHLPFQMVDERLTSFEARQGTQEKRGQKDLDAIAACLMIESWFDAQPS